MTAQPRRHDDRKPGPAGSPRHATQQVPPDDDSTAAAGRSGQDPRSGRLADSVNEAARLTGRSRDLLYDEMRISDWSSDVCSSDLSWLTSSATGSLASHPPSPSSWKPGPPAPANPNQTDRKSVV